MNKEIHLHNSQQGGAGMKRLTILLSVISFSLFAMLGTAISEEMELPPYKGSQAFESMKSLLLGLLLH